MLMRLPLLTSVICFLTAGMVHGATTSAVATAKPATSAASATAMPVATTAKPAAVASTTPAFPSAAQIARASSATVPTPTLNPALHASFVEQAKKGGIDVLFLGDSITDWWREADPATKHNGKQVFDKYFGNMKVANFGIAAEGTQHLLWRLQNGEGTGFSPKVIMLMIGTNNLGRNSDDQIVLGILAVLNELRKDFPSARIVLLGIFPRGPAADAVRGRIARINQTISKLNNLNNIFYYDIGPRFLARDGSIPADVMADLLHPTSKGYEIWAQAIQEPLANLLKLPPLTTTPAAK